MATVVIALQSTCGANNHVRLSATLDGSASREFVITVDELTEAWDADKAHDAIVYLLKLASKGRTRAQIRTALQNGLTITVP